MLLARINEKKSELDGLKELRDLSADLATQMQTLEEKLSTLSNGTEGQYSLIPQDNNTKIGHVLAVAVVLSNWHNVLRAINIASSERCI